MIDSAQKNRFSTEVRSIHALGNSRYLIPTYQRPYVWSTEQVLKFLDDFWSAYTNRDNNYFIGTIMTSLQDGKEELIDGQQRFTTLWLVAVAFKNIGIESEIISFLKAGNELRFDFAIREKLKDYLTLLMEDKGLAMQKFSTKEIEDDDYLINIAKAVSTVEGRLRTLNQQTLYSLQEFGNYIYKNIQFVKNTTPPGIDLNKLFATINNSGIQLEQTDILKANLLKRIKTEKELYSRIWEACENMENYFERNVLKLFPKSDKSQILPDNFRSFDSHKFLFMPVLGDREIADQTDAGYSLYDILNDRGGSGVVSDLRSNIDYTADNDTDNVVYCESILSFGQLLLHTYRGFLVKKGYEDFELPFHVKNLLAIFKDLETKSEEEIKAFFKYLWEVRYIFDKYVVKWITEPGEKDKMLFLTSVYKDSVKEQFSRSIKKEKDDLLMLQSVLYFTSNYNTQIWLSPFLKRLAENEDALLCLEAIDNELSTSKLEDKTTTYKLMNKEVQLDEKEDFVTYLKSSLGTAFKHYWFQKLEYILWKNWPNIPDKRFEGYRITSKNSIEHISPQKPEYGEKLDSNILDSFGNLALLNVSQNSSYSNQYVSKKKIDFDNKVVYDSLKLFYVYNGNDTEKWGKEEIMAHELKMIEIITAHYKTD